MKTKYKRFPHLPLLIAGIAVILFSSAGIAHIVGWIPTASGNTGNAFVPEALPAVKGRCAECGVIVSMREIEVHDRSGRSGAATEVVGDNSDETREKSNRRHELTIRLADGSSRVIIEENSAKWRLEERVIVIDGVSSLNQ
jgi:outer membrane lipoprotein SlyB